MTDIKEHLKSSVEHVKERINESDDVIEEIDPLDVKLTVDLLGRVSEIYVVTGTGGPHLEIETHTSRVIGYWGKEEIWRRIDDEKADRLWNYYKQLFENR